MHKHVLKRVLMVLVGLFLSIALLSGCDLFNQKPITITKVNNVSLQVDETKNITVQTTPSDVTIKAVSDNPSIATVSVNKNVLTIKGKTDGEAEITITATKSGNKTASLKFQVIVTKPSSKPNIVGVASFEDIVVVLGTLFSDISLPDKVQVTLDDETNQSLSVNWSQGNYSGNTIGTYTIEGSFSLDNGITNTNQIKAEIKIIVGEPVTKDVTSVETFLDKEVLFGTVFANLDLPDKVEVTLGDQTKQFLAVDWSDGDYDSNIPGTYKIEGSLILVDGITNTSNIKAEIKVLVPVAVKGNIRSVETLLEKRVPYEKEFVDTGLPDRVKVTLDDDSELFLEVDWNEGNYDGSSAGEEYLIEGSLVLSSEITNTNNCFATIKIIVNNPPIITSLTPDDSTFRKGEIVDLLVSANDIDGDILTYSWKDNTGNSYESDGSFTIGYDEIDTCQIWVEVSDGLNTAISDIRTFIFNAYPEITSFTASETVIKIDEEITFEVIAVDYDDDNLTYSWQEDWVTIEGEESSSLTWTPKELGIFYIAVIVSDDGGESETRETIQVSVVEEFIPEIKAITGPDTIISGQKNVRFTAEYDHRGISKEDLNVRWEVTGGTIVQGQDTGEIEWNAPEEKGTYHLTFFVDDGVTGEIQDTIDVYVKKPNIYTSFDYDEVAINSKYRLSIGVDTDIYLNTDTQISVSASDGELVVYSDHGNWIYYIWTSPNTPAIATITFEAIINGVEFIETKEVNVIENQPPIIDFIAVNDSLIDLDSVLVLNTNEFYNFEIEVVDTDSLDINWAFYPYDGEGNEFFGSIVEYAAEEIGLVYCFIGINDGTNPVVETQFFIIFEDDSVSEITDPNKIETIEMISDDIAVAFEEKNLDLIINHFHPDREEILIYQFGQSFLDTPVDSMHRLDRYLITFDPYTSIYTTYVLYNFAVETRIDNIIFPLFFKEDSNGDVKLYNVWDEN